MNSIDFPDQKFLDNWPYRVCLPYGVDILQLARWMNAVKENNKSPEFDITVGDRTYTWSGLDAIELFIEIQRECLNCILFHSYVISKSCQSILFFDKYDRFSFFSADLSYLHNIYPFSCEIMWENFNLLQVEDHDTKLADIFQAIQSV